MAMGGGLGLVGMGGGMGLVGMGGRLGDAVAKDDADVVGADAQGEGKQEHCKGGKRWWRGGKLKGGGVYKGFDGVTRFC